MKIVFMGTPDFAVNILEALKDKHEILCVVTQPDKPQGRKRTIVATPVKEYAQKSGFCVLQPERIRNKDFISLLAEKGKDADIFVVAAYGQILPEKVLNMPKHGCINVHGSILPKYRGAAPIQWAIINGEETTGITIMKMDKGIDTGDMILQRELKIEEDDTCESLFKKMSVLGANALLEAITQMEKGDYSFTPQDNTYATYAPMIIKETELIDFTQTSKKIIDLMRALAPDMAAYTFYKGDELKIWAAEVSDKKSTGKPGEIVEINKNGILVNTADFCLLLKEVQPKSGKRMEAAAFTRGHLVKAGESFLNYRIGVEL